MQSTSSALLVSATETALVVEEQGMKSPPVDFDQPFLSVIPKRLATHSVTCLHDADPFSLLIYSALFDIVT
jgi:DNA topoisomerase VI subunit A